MRTDGSTPQYDKSITTNSKESHHARCCPSSEDSTRPFRQQFAYRRCRSTRVLCDCCGSDHRQRAESWLQPHAGRDPRDHPRPVLYATFYLGTIWQHRAPSLARLPRPPSARGLDRFTAPLGSLEMAGQDDAVSSGREDAARLEERAGSDPMYYIDTRQRDWTPPSSMPVGLSSLRASSTLGSKRWEWTLPADTSSRSAAGWVGCSRASRLDSARNGESHFRDDDPRRATRTVRFRRRGSWATDARCVASRTTAWTT